MSTILVYYIWSGFIQPLFAFQITLFDISLSGYGPTDSLRSLDSLKMDDNKKTFSNMHVLASLSDNPNTLQVIKLLLIYFGDKKVAQWLESDSDLHDQNVPARGNQDGDTSMPCTIH